MPLLELGGVGGMCVASHIGRARIPADDRPPRPATSTLPSRSTRRFALADALAVTTNPIPLKAALNMLGFEVGSPRLPLVEATDDERRTISTALERSGVLAAPT